MSAAPAIPIDNLRQEGEQGPPICVIVGDRLAGLAATGQMIDGAWKLHAQGETGGAQASVLSLKYIE